MHDLQELLIAGEVTASIQHASFTLEQRQCLQLGRLDSAPTDDFGSMARVLIFAASR